MSHFLHQIEDFRAGRPHSSDPRKPNVPTMIALAAALSDDEARAVAEFCSTQRGGPHEPLIEVAYVPVGSIEEGRTIVRTGHRAGADTPPVMTPCATCHGETLMGSGDAPPIAGRSPSYMARQLHDFKSGARRGTMAVQMQPVVAALGANDLLVIAAYVASLPGFPGDASTAEAKRGP